MPGHICFAHFIILFGRRVCIGSLHSLGKSGLQPIEQGLPFLIMPLLLTLALQQKPKQFGGFAVPFTLQHDRQLNLIIFQSLREQHNILFGGGTGISNKGTSFRFSKCLS
ncbi:hypothetical protein D3C73_1158810 [compost metagenome]